MRKRRRSRRIFFDEQVNSQRKRARCHKEPTPPSSLTHIQTATSLNLHITTFRSHNSSSHRTVRYEPAIFHCSVTRSLRLETDVKYECGPLSLARVLLNTQVVGDTLESVSEKRRIQDLPHTERLDGDGAARRHSLINEAGDSVPSSQDSVTRAVQNLCISDSPVAPAALPAPPPPTTRNARRPPRPKQMPREYLRCAQCGPVADAHLASTDGGLMQHKRQKHGGQVLLAD